MTPVKLAIGCVLVMLLAIAASASAQTATERPAHRLEATVGAAWLGGASLGESTAELRANRTGTPAPFTLFDTESRFGSGVGFDLRAGYGLTRSFTVEFGLLYSRPEVQTRVTGDVENAPELSVVEPVEQYFIDGSLVMMLDGLAIGSRTVPFVSGGAGYLRQLHEGQTLVESGPVYHVGAGVKPWFARRDSGFVRGAGIRVDGRLYLLVNGIELEGSGARPHGSISGSVFLTF
jgi:hypothetical protein